MSSLLTWLRRLTAAAVIAAALLLFAQCIDGFLSGSRAAALSAGSAVFSREDAAARLLRVLPVFALAGLLTVCTFTVQSRTQKDTQKARPQKPAPQPKAAGVKAQGLLLALSALFILLGVMNGGLHDVLVKAIQICTECIGLG